MNSTPSICLKIQKYNKQKIHLLLAGPEAEASQQLLRFSQIENTVAVVVEQLDVFCVDLCKLVFIYTFLLEDSAMHEEEERNFMYFYLMFEDYAMHKERGIERTITSENDLGR